MKSFRRNRWRVRDARGGFVGLFDAPTIAAVAASLLNLDAEEYRSIRREATRSARIAMISGVLAGGLGLVMSYQTILNEGLSMRGVCVTLAGLALVVAGILSFRMRGNADPELFADAMLRHGRCARCAYSVVACKPDPQDGCTVCPECGAAWKFEADAAVEGRG